MALASTVAAKSQSPRQRSPQRALVDGGTVVSRPSSSTPLAGGMQRPSPSPSASLQPHHAVSMLLPVDASMATTPPPSPLGRDGHAAAGPSPPAAAALPLATPAAVKRSAAADMATGAGGGLPAIGHTVGVTLSPAHPLGEEKPATTTSRVPLVPGTNMASPMPLGPLRQLPQLLPSSGLAKPMLPPPAAGQGQRPSEPLDACGLSGAVRSAMPRSIAAIYATRGSEAPAGGPPSPTEDLGAATMGTSEVDGDVEKKGGGDGPEASLPDAARDRRMAIKRLQLSKELLTSALGRLQHSPAPAAVAVMPQQGGGSGAAGSSSNSRAPPPHPIFGGSPAAAGAQQQLQFSPVPAFQRVPPKP